MTLPATYATGTITVAANGTTVTGTGTNWLAGGIRGGDVLEVRGLSVGIESVTSATGLTIKRPWPGAALSGAAYDIRYTPDASRVLAASRAALEAFEGLSGDIDNANATLVADLPSLIASDRALPAGTSVLTRAEGHSYEVIASGGDLVTAGGVQLRVLPASDGSYSARAFGARGDNSTDDWTALQRAVDRLTALFGGVLRIPAGNYRLTQTLKVTGRGITLEGVGRGGRGSDPFVATSLVGDHSSGPVLHIEGEESNTRNIRIDASAARRAGSATGSGGRGNFGLIYEPPDVAGQVFLGDFDVRQVHILNQPGHAAVFAGACRRGVIEQLFCRSNAGHGIVVSSGPLIGRTNGATGGSGMLDFRSCTTDLCGGHGIVVGDPGSSLRAFRVLFRSHEASDNAGNPTLRIGGENSQMWIRGDEIEVAFSAVRGIQNGGYSGGIYAEGRGHRYTSNRYVACAHSVKIGSGGSGFEPRGIVIDQVRALQDPNPSPQTHAVIIPSNARGTIVRSHMAAGITNLVQDGGQGTRVELLDGARAVETADSIATTRRASALMGFNSIGSSEEQTIAQDGVFVIDFGEDVSGGILFFHCNFSSAPAGFVHFRARSGPFVVKSPGITNDASLDVTTGILTGTTGANGKLTISAHTDRNLYIENRLGGARNYSFTILR